MGIRKRIRHSCGKRKRAVRSWTNRLAGYPCFLVGSGPSLNDHPMKKIDKYFLIGVNHSYQKVFPTILMWQDIEFWYSARKDLKKVNSIKYCRNVSDPTGSFYTYSLSSRFFEIPTDATILHGRGNSGALAFELACILGCNPIILFGFDCKYRGKNTDFYGVNRFHKRHTLRCCHGGLKWIKSMKNEKKIINCSDNKVFKKQHSMDEAIDMVHDLYPQTGKAHFINRILGP